MIKNNSLNMYSTLRSALSIVVISIAVSACSPTDSNRAINTGDSDFETNYGLLSGKQAAIDALVYVSSPRLNIRSQPNTDAGSIVGTVELNDILRIVPTRNASFRSSPTT